MEMGAGPLKEDSRESQATALVSRPYVPLSILVLA
jgi:hypothetical protein